MATRGQTHQKRAREAARKERRELKQVKKAQRAAGELPVTAEDAESVDGQAEVEPETEIDEAWIQ